MDKTPVKNDIAPSSGRCPVIDPTPMPVDRTDATTACWHSLPVLFAR